MVCPIERGIAVHLLVHREPVEATTVAHLVGLLGPDESSRRFYFERDRNAHLLAHAWLRQTLSRYGSVAPEDWCFSSGAWGKPQVANRSERSLCFNLSHTKGCIACVVSRGREVGIDVERFDAVEDPLPLAERCFSAEETAMLGRLQGEQRQRRFCELWTLKEAYLKARGLGLSSLTTLATPSALAPDRTSGWQIEQLMPTSQHHVAIVASGRDLPVWTTIEESPCQPFPTGEARDVRV
jgi:4'-phosphopantetheinyl transferase